MMSSGKKSLFNADINIINCQSMSNH